MDRITEWFEKPKTMEEVKSHKKSAMQAMIIAAVLLCILMIAGLVGFASKLVSIVIGVLLGAGLVRWLQARKVEETLTAKDKPVESAPVEPAPRTNEAVQNTPSVVPAPMPQSEASADIVQTPTETTNNSTTE